MIRPEAVTADDKRVSPGGVTHQSARFDPRPVVPEGSSESRKKALHERERDLRPTLRFDERPPDGFSRETCKLNTAAGKTPANQHRREPGHRVFAVNGFSKTRPPSGSL